MSTYAESPDLLARIRELEERVARLDEAALDADMIVNDEGDVVIPGSLWIGGDGGSVELYTADMTAPTGLTLTLGADEHDAWMDVSWTAPTGDGEIRDYEVELSLNGFGVVQTVRTEGTSYRFNNLKPGTGYTVRVRGFDLVGVATDYVSSGATTVGDSTAPATVTGVVASAGLRSIVVVWSEVADTDVVSGLGQYRVQLATDSGFAAVVRDKSTGGTIAAFTDLAANTQYWARVKAVDYSGNESVAWSSSATATTAQAGNADIQAGTITSDHIVAAGLDAAVIKFGTMSGDRITANTLDVGALKSSSLTAATITLVSSGLLRAGTTSSPYNYLLMDAAGIRMYANGTAAYTGGTEKIRLDVATGNVSLKGSLTVGGADNSGSELLVVDANEDTLLEAGGTEGEVGVETLNAGRIICEGLLYKTEGAIGTADINYYIDPSTGDDDANDGLSTTNPFETISHALSLIEQVNNLNYNIYVKQSTTCYEEVEINGQAGSGQIIFDSWDGSTNWKLNGWVRVEGSWSNYIAFNHMTLIHDGDTENNNILACFFVTASAMVRCSNCIFNGNTTADFGAEVRRGGHAFFADCRFSNNNDCGVRVYQMGHVYVQDCNGSTNTNYGVRVVRGSTYGQSGTGPTGGTNLSSAWGSHTWGDTTTTGGTESTASVSKTKLVYATAADSWVIGSGWKSGTDNVYQGNWGYGNHKGLWFFGSGAWTFLSGKTIDAVYIRIKRRAAGGYSAGRKPVFRTHGYATKPGSEPSFGNSWTSSKSFAWGDKKEVKLPSSLYSNLGGSTLGFGIYITANLKSDYMIFHDDICRVRVVYH